MSSSAHAGLRVELGYMRSACDLPSGDGWLWAIAVMGSHQSTAAGDPAYRGGAFTGPIAMDTRGFDLALGYAWPVGLGMQLEVTPLFGVGLATISDRALVVGSSGMSSQFSGYGLSYEYGLRVGIASARIALDVVATVGITALVSHTSAHLSYRGQARTVDETVTIEAAGLAPFASIGWRF